MKGASWEQALACAQHYGIRGTLVCPSTVPQLKEWTDAGKPVMIAWNPEGRDWSHASVVFDVTEDPEHGFLIHVADPNIPDPDETVRVVPKAEFYKKWFEKWPDYLVRRPALMLDREITPDGRQVMASAKRAYEIYVDSYGMAHDDEGNTWDAMGTPPGVYAGAAARRVRGGPAPVRRAPRPSDPDYSKKYEVLFELVKKNPNNSFLQSLLAQLVSRRSLSPKQEQAVLKFLRNPEHVVLFGGTPPTPPPSRRPDPEVSAGMQEVRLQAMDNLLKRRPGDSFLMSLRDQIARGRTLSEKQLTALRQNFYRAGMKTEADMFRTASARLVAKTYVLGSSQKLPPSTRAKVNEKLSRAGLDGNGRYRKPEEGYSAALTVLRGFGIELDEVVSSHLFRARPSGTVRADVAFTNPEDPFSPASISNSLLYLNFTELRDGVFEVTAYLS
jgi:hypothetical protein